MEVLLEYRGSRRELSVASSETVVEVIARELRRVGRRQAKVVTADADLSQPNGEGKIFILQKWSTQWDCYVDVNDSAEVCDGDRLAVISKPKPPTRLMRLCCCGCAVRDEDRHRKATSSMLNGVKKNEEIQSLDYKFNVESELSSHASEWESQSLKAVANDGGEVVDDYIRSDSGRASWRLVPNKPLAHSQLDTGADSINSRESQVDNDPADEGAAESSTEAVKDTGDTADKTEELAGSPEPCTEQASDREKEEEGEVERQELDGGSEVNEGEPGGESQAGGGETHEREEAREDIKDKADS